MARPFGRLIRDHFGPYRRTAVMAILLMLVARFGTAVLELVEDAV